MANSLETTRPKIDKVIELVYIIEGLMMKGYSNPSSLIRCKELAGYEVTRTQAVRFIDHISKMWAKGINHQDIGRKRAQLVQMHLKNIQDLNAMIDKLRESMLYALLPQQFTISQEINRNITNITKSLIAIGDLQGLREHTIRIGGDREQIPIQQSRETRVLEELRLHGIISGEQLERIETNILERVATHGEEQRQIVAGSIWSPDEDPNAETTSLGDNSSSTTEDMERGSVRSLPTREREEHLDIRDSDTMADSTEPDEVHSPHPLERSEG